MTVTDAANAGWLLSTPTAYGEHIRRALVKNENGLDQSYLELHHRLRGSKVGGAPNLATMQAFDQRLVFPQPSGGTEFASGLPCDAASNPLHTNHWCRHPSGLVSAIEKVGTS